jgi:hypothetical protein
MQLLYRNIIMWYQACADECFAVLSKNAKAADAVRNVVINFSTPVTSFHFPDLHQKTVPAFGLAIRACAQITTLKIYVTHSPTAYLDALDGYTIPCLRHFECSVPFCDSLSSFLTRHTTITTLRLQSPVFESDTPCVLLPNLERYTGSSLCIHAVARSAALRSASIDWPRGGGYKPILELLADSSRESLNEIKFQRLGWNLDMMVEISQSLPHVKRLHLINLLSDVSDLEERIDEVVLKVGEYLPNFAGLRRLRFRCLDERSKEIEAEELSSFHSIERGFETVTLWGEICPTLEECTLYDGQRWTRMKANLWLPDTIQTRGMRWVNRNKGIYGIT